MMEGVASTIIVWRSKEKEKILDNCLMRPRGGDAARCLEFSLWGDWSVQKENFREKIRRNADISINETI